jgi:hypothetical protein
LPDLFAVFFPGIKGREAIKKLMTERGLQAPLCIMWSHLKQAVFYRISGANNPLGFHDNAQMMYLRPE